MKSRIIQCNLHPIRTILEGVKEDTGASLIIFFEAFYMVELVADLQTSGLKLDFCSLLYRSLISVVKMNVE